MPGTEASGALPMARAAGAGAAPAKVPGPGSAGEFTVHGVVSKLVGRDEALAQLNQALRDAVAKRAPQIVTIIGNQGTGKSRLIAEWIFDVEAPTRVVRARPAATGARYSAIARLLRDRLGLPEGEEPETWRERFRTGVQQVFGDRRVDEHIHFLGRYVGLRFADSQFVRAFDADSPQHDEIARTMLRSFIETDAAAAPLVLVIDDLHLADDDTLALIEELGEGLAGSPVVFVQCARPELLVRRPRWGMGTAAHVRVELGNLESEAAGQMCRQLLARCDRVPPDLVEDAVAMTGGNPFFLEQLVRMMVANGTIDTSGARWQLDVDRAAATELPLSVEEAIEARIAALGRDELRLLEMGATFGNVFWVGGLVALERNERAVIAQLTTPPAGLAVNHGAGHAAASASGSVVAPAGTQLAQSSGPSPVASDPIAVQVGDGSVLGWRDDGLAERFLRTIQGLVERDYLLLLPTGDSSVPGEIEVMFKHNLERDLIARLTDHERRRRYPLVAALWLETRLGDRQEDQREFLGQLFERGGDQRRAAQLYIAAGDALRARYGNEQAVELYRRGLALLRPADTMLRLEALHNLGDVLALVGQTDEALTRFREMLEAAWRLDLRAKGGAAHGRVGRIHRQRGDLKVALDHFRLAHSLFQKAGDRRGVAGALDDAGQVYWLIGVYPTALECHQKALNIRRQLGDRRSIALALANLGLVERDLGSFAAAIDHLREAMEIRREIGDRRGVVASLCGLGSVHAADGKLEEALETLDEALRMSREIGDRGSQATVLGRLAEVELQMGRLRAAADHLQDAQEIVIALGDRIGQAETARRVAEVCVALGKWVEAESQARRALEIAGTVGSRPQVAASERLLGEVLGAFAASPEEQEEAERHFTRAIDILKALRNDLELARCYRAFAGFRERCGLHASAADLRARADAVFGRLQCI